MRKRLIGPAATSSTSADGDWLDLESLASVEITSEDPSHPIEGALSSSGGPGWRASQPGQQTIRLLFDAAQTIRRIRLLFEEAAAARTQEFVLRWSNDGGRSLQEIVRQQYNFSPPDTVREQEDYEVSLDGLTVLELGIVPHVGRDDVFASLRQFRLA